MDCPSQDNTACATVLHATSQFSAVKERTSTILLSPETSVESIYKAVAETYGYEADQIYLVLQANCGPSYTLSKDKDKTLEQIGIVLSQSNTTITIHMQGYKKMALDVQETYEDDLLLGGSASPTMGDVSSAGDQRDDLPAIEGVPLSCNYVGLVNQYALSKDKDKALEQKGTVLPESNTSSTVHTPGYKKMALDVQETYEDDLLLGASASPTMGDVPSTSGQRDVLPAIEAVPLSCSYVGLVNQAMTCYLNSLLQALYMTPEFRNALYNWEFDGVNESRSIPYQLQKLFLNLQTSSKSAVETTDLTTSFGWQGSDAWHQHDIQELCRVMFDALEQKFKDTEQANLINDLYEGKMLDYVKCLECGTEKSREDTFLDIPLPVRAFCSALAYNSLEEALRAFVLPETLDGNNQYYCEKCNKKCDAHKGLKFTKFPYLLTLHLKRFDFDYNTMHRIKLNDKVVFPEKLNLNSFITQSQVIESESTIDEKEHVVRCDECSTTDSGSADDESCQGTDISSTVNGHDDNCVDSDEGIDVSLGNNHHEEDMKGPYIYELFSIMIHSGSASGGHYYAYIKDFDRNMWFCFNDQTVSGITEDDIRKTYGGGPLRGYYSGAYSSSTNAYMLMYRQIDKERNAFAMTMEEFPPHIKNLLEDMRRKEEEDRRNKEKENDMIKVTVFCIHPMNNELLEDGRLNLFSDNTMEEAKYDAIRRLKLESFVNPNDCRLVLYNRKQDCIDKSFESDQIKVCDALRGHYRQPHLDLFLEIKDPDAQWETYKTGGINMRVYPIVLETEDIEESKLVRVDVGDTVGDLKLKLSTLFDMESSSIKIVKVTNSNEPKYLEKDDEFIEFDSNCSEYKLYVSNCLDEDPGKQFHDSKLKKLINQFECVISLNIILPKTDIGTLESLSIPSLDLNQNLDKLELGGGDRGLNSPSLRVSPQPYQCDGIGDQSNSEDSSLSDSDRTLVGATPGECGGMALLSSCPSSPADQHMGSPSDHCEDDYNAAQGHPNGEEMSWDEVETNTSNAPMYLYVPMSSYFKVTSIGVTSNSLHFCRVLADKRMTLEQLKKHLEEVVRVPSEYFKIHKYFQGMEDEWSCLTDTLLSGCPKDGEKLIVHLGRVPRKDEVKCAIFHLKLNVMDPHVFLFDHIFAKGQTVKEVKREIIFQAKKQKMLDIPLNKCRLREKSCKRPRKIYFDEQQFDKDIRIVPNMEMYVQELGDVEKVTSLDQIVLFVRQFCPSTLTLKPFQEVALDDSGATLKELKEKIAEISEIPVENVEVAHVKDTIPCDMNVLEINNDLDWNPSVTVLDSWPLRVTDGHVFYYRDSREVLKELTREEREEVIQRENARLGKPSLKSFSPGRERALKIYLDTPPASKVKTEDACID